jgi:hypothetical protein
MVQKLHGLAALSMVALLALGCGKGLSQEDAKVRCDQEKTAKAPQCFDVTKTYDDCMSCYQECGDDCRANAECPATYTCDGEGTTGGGETEAAQ